MTVSPGYRDRMSLVGRDDELRRVEGLLAEARAERSGALVVRGEAGVGKSVLLGRAVSVARSEGFQVVSGVGVESDSELAYGGLHQLLFPHLDRLAGLPEPQAAALRAAFGLAEGGAANRFLISAGTLALLADLAEEAPLLCLVDDLQWLDQGSAAALLFVARRFEADRIAMLFAVRETSMPFETPGVEVMHLSGLTAGDAGRLLDRHAPELADPLRARVLEESAGNPLAIIELGSSRRDTDDPDLCDHCPAGGRGARRGCRRPGAGGTRHLGADRDPGRVPASTGARSCLSGRAAGSTGRSTSGVRRSAAG